HSARRCQRRYRCIDLEPLLNSGCSCGPCRDTPRGQAQGATALRRTWASTGLAPENSVQKWQNRLTPLWKRLAGGCHLNRPISSLIEDAGFHVTQVQAGYMPGPKAMT